MKQKLLFFLDCSRAAEFCDKTEYREMNFIGKLRLRMHLLFCSDCREYRKRNQKLSHLLEKANLHTCTSEEKKRWQQQLQQQVGKPSDS